MLPLIIPILGVLSTVVGGVAGVNSIIKDGEQLDTLNQGLEIINQQTGLLNANSIMLSGLQSSMGFLTNVSMVGVGLSAFSLYQTHKLSKNMQKNMKHISDNMEHISNKMDTNFLNIQNQINNGFLDLKHFTNEKIEFSFNETQRLRLKEGFQSYSQANKNIKTALNIKDIDSKKLTLLSSQKQLDDALIIYNAREELNVNSSVTKLKHLEIIALIEGLKSETYFLLNEEEAGKQHYSELYKKMDTELKLIAEMADDKTIDLIISDTEALRNNDMKSINKLLSKKEI